jgi:hypothetical protein
MFVRSLEDLRSAGTTSRRAPLGPLASRIIALPRQTSARATEIWAYPGIIGLSLSPARARVRRCVKLAIFCVELPCSASNFYVGPAHSWPDDLASTRRRNGRVGFHGKISAGRDFTQD